MAAQNSDIYEKLKRLEIALAKSFPILPGYLYVLNINTFKTCLSDVYNSIPQEVKDAREFLSGRGQSGIYDFLKVFEINLSKGIPIIPNLFSIVKLNNFESLIDKIYATLPEEVMDARKYLGIQ